MPSADPAYCVSGSLTLLCDPQTAKAAKCEGRTLTLLCDLLRHTGNGSNSSAPAPSHPTTCPARHCLNFEGRELMNGFF
nr:hypothetical protein Iba_chr02dCG10140 [Ipomoea batatas]